MDDRSGSVSNGPLGEQRRDAGAALERQGEELRERLSELNRRLVHFVRERPGASLILAVSLGYLFGRIVRS
jgi:hypothetical protein